MHNTKPYDVIQLTWLRGIAVMFVLLSHLCRLYEYEYITGEEQDVFFLFKLFDLGSFGVMLFFALSGCTLYLSNSTNKKNLNYRHLQYLIKRFFRIWPAFMVSLACYLILLYFFTDIYQGADSSWLTNQFMVNLLAIDYWSYALLFNNYLGQYQVINGAYWSLPIEFQFYLLLPFIIFLLRFSTLYVVLLMVALYSIFLWQPFKANDYLFYQTIFSFGGGVLAAHFRNRITVKFTLLNGGFVLIFACASALVIKSGIITTQFYYELWSIVAVALVYIFLQLDVSKVQHNVITTFIHNLGQHSYSVYLFHNLVFALLYCGFLRYGSVANYTNQILFAMVSITVTLVLSRYSFRYLEQNSISLGRFLANKLQHSVEKQKQQKNQFL